MKYDFEEAASRLLKEITAVQKEINPNAFKDDKTKTDAPKEEKPKEEQPKQEIPKPEPPPPAKQETSKPEAPKPDPPKPEPPPKQEAPKPEPPKQEIPKHVISKQEAPKPANLIKGEKPNGAFKNVNLVNPPNNSVVVYEKIPQNQAGLKEIQLKEGEISKWFQEKRIHPNITANLLPCNSDILQELLAIKMKAPDFFYKAIENLNYPYKSTPLREVAQFSHELNKMFLK